MGTVRVAARRPLERSVEVVLAVGLVLSGALLATGLAASRPDVLRAGVLLLMATPAARLVVLTFGFFRRRDWLFAVAALAVLAVLAGGALLGGG